MAISTTRTEASLCVVVVPASAELARPVQRLALRVRRQSGMPAKNLPLQADEETISPPIESHFEGKPLLVERELPNPSLERTSTG